MRLGITMPFNNPGPLPIWIQPSTMDLHQLDGSGGERTMQRGTEGSSRLPSWMHMDSLRLICQSPLDSLSFSHRKMWRSKRPLGKFMAGAVLTTDTLL